MRKQFNYTTIYLFILTIFLTIGVMASDQIPAPPQSQPIAIMNAEIHPLSGPVIENGTILFDKGKITAMGKDLVVAMNAITIDASGRSVYPAMIALGTRLGLIEISAVDMTRDYNESGQIKPNVRAEVAVNPDSELIPVTRSNGIAIALTIPQGGIISGTFCTY
jgi:imidazolonepropionase-like amidohydrolase